MPTIMSNALCRLSLAILAALSLSGCGTKPKPAPEEVPSTPVAASKETPAATPATTSPADEPAARPEEETVAAEQPSAAAEPSKETPATAGTALIPRRTLFGNPDKSLARISPDGTRISYLAPLDGVLNVFVAPLDDPSAAKPVTQEKKRRIPAYFWAYDSKHILYVQDVGGDEDWHVYAVDLAAGTTKDLTPLPKIAAQIDAVSEKFPEEILVGMNDRDPQYHDLYRVNIVSGDRTLVQKNTEFSGFITDDDFQVRFASKMTPDGGSQLLEPDGQGGWKDYRKIDMEDTLTTSPVGFDKTGKILYMTDSRGRDTSALVQIDLASGKETVLAADERVDVGGVLSHPTEKTIQAVTINYDRPTWKILDPAIEEDMRYLATVAQGELQVPIRTLDDKIWTVAYLMDDGPVSYYRYDRASKKATFLFTNRKSLEGLPLAKMHPVVIPARDKLNLVSYLTLPKAADPENKGRPNEPLPLVLVVHGGPWGRDAWGFDAEHQLLANRGYAVLSVNFRGSTGLGKGFTNAGNKEWAGKMHDDLIDAVDWAIAEKIADPARMAIMGGSYGGYATLVGVTFTPEKFACGVDVVGPSNLITLLSTIPLYWVPQMQLFKDRVGDPTTDEGKKLLGERSPLNFVEKIQRPLLIGQGANDPRVKQAEADQIVGAMREKKIPVTYVLFPDEGHGFARPENNLAFYAVTEAFLARHLGGRYQPIGGDFAGSSLTCPDGGDQVPGLAEALKKPTAEKPAAATP
jgi:dipeptidyl aminopeptidase/acylaminoacyl peptidase